MQSLVLLFPKLNLLSCEENGIIGMLMIMLSSTLLYYRRHHVNENGIKNMLTQYRKKDARNEEKMFAKEQRTLFPCLC